MSALAARFAFLDVRLAYPAARAPRRCARRTRASADPAGLDGFDLFGADAFGPPSTSRPKKKASTGPARGSRGARPSSKRSSSGAGVSTLRSKPVVKPRTRGAAPGTTRRRSANELLRDASRAPATSRTDASDVRDANDDDGDDARSRFEESPVKTLDAAIAVEGANDARAVRAAVRPRHGVVLLKGAYDSKSGHHVVPADVIDALSRMARNGVDVVVLTDADVAGRQLRTRVALEVPSALHAFIGAHESVAREATKWHEAGNVGVEHATPTAVRRALFGARRAHCGGKNKGVTRDAFNREHLEKCGLCGPLGASAPDAKWSKYGGVAHRRRLVGEFLGVGDCDAKQLTRQLNLFFSFEEFQAAVDALPGEGEKAERGRTRESFADADEEGDVDIWAYVPPGQAPPGFR
jgi:5S rRNA maturation endonuclease (ribonuclease M5)